MDNKEITYDYSTYPVWGDNSHNEKPGGDGEMPPNLNTPQSVQDVNAWNETVKQRQTDTFSPKKAASWDGSYNPKGV